MSEPFAIVAVLAGGRGRRLGGSKATASLAGRPLIEYPLAAARAAGLETVVVAKPDTTLPVLTERVLREPEEPHHPLCGVLAALDFAGSRSPAPAVLLVACDMPLLTGALLSWLAGLQGAAMAELDGRPEPLIARCLPSQRGVLQEALDGRRPLRAALGSLAPRMLDETALRRFGNPRRLCFNINLPEDLETAERWLAEL